MDKMGKELTITGPYCFDKKEKSEFITGRMKELTAHHSEHCTEYHNILEALEYDEKKVTDPSKIPFLPVRIFKEMELKSIADEEIFKIMTSSGTTGQSVSKIILDKETAMEQQSVMVKIVSDFIGSTRMPMIIIDSPSVIKDRNMFSARGAGILGFSIFGTHKMYALNEDMSLNVGAVTEFLEKHKGQRILLFGFTFMIWQHFYKGLVDLDKNGKKIDLSDCVMIHGGGWKKLISEAVSPEAFKNSFTKVCGLKKIYNYYGMVEQTGCIYMECEYGHFHCSVYSDILIRNPHDFSSCAMKNRGIIQVMSVLPRSYPGHSLLTEDEGAILGEDDCPCGRKGKYFEIYGRLKNAELRGCSDTYAAKF